MSGELRTRKASMIAYAVMVLAVVGYFVGLQSPMNPPMTASRRTGSSEDLTRKSLGDRSKKNGGSIISIPSSNEMVVNATHYAEMHNVIAKLAAPTNAQGPLFPVPSDPFQLGGKSNESQIGKNRHPFEGSQESSPISIQEKRLALESRQKNRAFNGAPPTVPHELNEMTSAGCLACHARGQRTESLRIPRMSHPLFANCTQCHVGGSAAPARGAEFRANHFVGLAAPESGPQAFPGGPPGIPHSTWMRGDCLACHGPTGHRGIATTHAERQNCQQCHAPSSMLEQSLLDPDPKFLEGPIVKH
jgi:cytochrome c-type protein NapB